VAWALSQIWVVNEDPIYRKKPGNEHFFAYYDIFVRHAFGNYKDILKEVSVRTLPVQSAQSLC
jgi:hypothetical protein